MNGRRRVFLTGATGNWGRHVLREFAARPDEFDVVALVLPRMRSDPGGLRQASDR